MSKIGCNRINAAPATACNCNCNCNDGEQQRDYRHDSNLSNLPAMLLDLGQIKPMAAESTTLGVTLAVGADKGATFVLKRKSVREQAWF